MQDFKLIKLHLEHPIVKVTMNRPEKKNAMSPQLHEEMHDVLADLEFDDETQVLRHVRLEYDIAGAMQRISDAGLPRFLGERLQWGE